MPLYQNVRLLQNLRFKGVGYMSENREEKFDFDQFLFRCTEEFMKLKAAETRVIISGNDINYAPSLPLDSEWQEAGESVFRQVRFSAAFLYRQEVGYGILDFDRPVAVIKFGHELYWRTVPKRHAQECIAEAKQRKVYVDINVQPVRQPIDGKSKEVMAFVNRCYEHVLQDDYLHFSNIETSYKGAISNFVPDIILKSIASITFFILGIRIFINSFTPNEIDNND